MKINVTSQRAGELFMLGESFLWGWFPIVTALTYQALTPVWSLTLSTLVSVLFFAGLMSFRNRWGELKNRAAYKDLAFSTVGITLLFLFLFLGLERTTAGNTAVILFLQVLFAFLFFNMWQKESIPRIHVAGAFFMGAGAMVILFPGTLAFNAGDLLVLLAAMTAPVANKFQQRARTRVSAETLLFVRAAGSIPFLWVLGVFLSGTPELHALEPIGLLLLINGFVLFGLSKMFWIEALHRISVTKASAMTAVAPLTTMLAAWPVLGEYPSFAQWIGVGVLLTGGFLITRPQ